METAMNLFDEESIIVLKMAIKEIIPPKTEKSPKSLLPKAFREKRVINKEHRVVIIIFEYNTTELIAIALLVFSCIFYPNRFAENFVGFMRYRLIHTRTRSKSEFSEIYGLIYLIKVHSNKRETFR